MDPLEHLLKRSMKPQDPPGDFARRVLKRIEAPPASEPWWGMWTWRFALAGALCFLMVVGSVVFYQQRQRQERLRGEAARDQLRLALQITDRQLQHVRQAMDRR